MHDVKDKVILITGAGRGVGKRLAIGLSAQGARVALLARSKAELDLANLEIEHNGGTSLRIRADVNDFEALCAAVDRTLLNYGKLDVLVCAAAILGPIGPFAETSPKAWMETVHTNLFGVMNSSRAVLPHMIQRRRGKLIVLGGRGSMGPRPSFSAYAASKAALVRFVETVAEEVRDHNVQVNVMLPGATYTSMTDEILRAGDRAGWKEEQEALELRVTGGIAPEKQIALAMFLASDASNHVSGKMISVTDDWRRLEQATLNPELYTLRRVQKV
ncbi:MAG TPA: SDR family oxidoreductase [Bryobacteraceae bacterium]|nr:SDR family oxidoreductase [Bryobacteraceae bacterium]